MKTKSQYLLVFGFVALVMPPLHAAVVINEILFNEPGSLERNEFIELHNTSGETIDLTNWRFTKGVDFVFAPGSLLPAGGFLAVVSSVDDFSAANPAVTVAGAYEGKLSNSGERLELVDAAGRVIDSFRYDDGEDWPQEADGDGASLELIKPSAPRDSPVNWNAAVPPTPGVANSSRAGTLPPRAYDVDIDPAKVTSDDVVTITARVFSETPVRDVLLRFEIHSGDPLTDVTMRDDGTGPDRSAGDGIYTANVDPQPDRTFVKLKIVIIDGDGEEHPWPSGRDESDHHAWFVYDGSIATNSPVIWLFLSPLKVKKIGQNAQFRSVHPNFDQAFDAFVVMDGKVHRKVAVRHRGGFFSRHAGRLKYSWRFEFPDWDLYNGRRAVLIQGNQHWDDPFMRGDNGLQDKLCYMTFDRAGVPSSRTRFIRLMVNNEFFGYHVEVEAIDDTYLERNGFTGEGDIYKHGQIFKAHNFPLPQPSEYGVAYEKKNNDRDDPSSIRSFIENLDVASRDIGQEALVVSGRIWEREGGRRPKEPTFSFSGSGRLDLSHQTVGFLAHNCLAEFDNLCIRNSEPGATDDPCNVLSEDGTGIENWEPEVGEWQGDDTIRLVGPLDAKQYRLAQGKVLDFSKAPITVSCDVRITSPKSDDNYAGVGLFLGDPPRHLARQSLITALRFRDMDHEGLHLLNSNVSWLDETGEFSWNVNEWYRFELTVKLSEEKSELQLFLEDNIDLERYRPYLASVILCTHWDSTSNNYYFYQDDLNGDRWTRFPFDMDITWGFSRQKRPPEQGHNLHPYDGTRFNPGRDEFMTSALREAYIGVRPFRRALHDTLAEALVTYFTESELHPVINRIVETDGEESQMDIKKWSALDRTWNWQSFAYHANFDKGYVSKRRKYLAEFLDREPLLSQASVDPATADDPLSFTVNALGTRYDARFDVGPSNLEFVKLHLLVDGAETEYVMEATNPIRDDFYSVGFETPGRPDRLFYRFSARDDSGREGRLPIPARDGYEYFVLDGEADAVPGDVVINEILYRTKYYNLEFVEVKNNLYHALDLSGWRLSSADREDEFVFPEGSVLSPTGYLVLSRDTRAVFEYYNIVNLVTEDLPFSLDNNSDTLSLWDDNGQRIDSVRYDDESPWPDEPDGNGPTLERIDARNPDATAANWAPSKHQGTPGRPNSVAAPEIPPQPERLSGLFHRGDVDADGSLNVTDAIVLLRSLFGGGRAPVCTEAADVDDNGRLNITDATRILRYLFQRGAPPTSPGPPGQACGPDPIGSPSDLGCEHYDACKL